MRFKRGSKVEVMNRKDVPISWRAAEILSGNGCTYTVRFDGFPGMRCEAIAENVSKKLIRPCPPPVEGVDNMVAGDIVEVFVEFSWKIASILKIFSGEQYLVRLLGCSQEFCIHISNIRIRQSWQDDRWILMRKGPGRRGSLKSSKHLASNCRREMNFQGPQSDAVTRIHVSNYCPPIQSNTGLQESRIVSSRSRKRISPYCSSIIESPTIYTQKRRTIEKDGRRVRANATPILEKVDNVALRREILDGKYFQASSNNKSHGYFELEKENLDGDLGCSLLRNTEPNGYDSDASSVGSCSVTSRSPIKFPSSNKRVPCQLTESICSDAESSYGSVDEEESYPHPLAEEVAAIIPRLELHAYRCTLEALYASGPLSWDQEALLTNLRINLHISNDEHLLELRNLIPSKSNSFNRQ